MSKTVNPLEGQVLVFTSILRMYAESLEYRIKQKPYVMDELLKSVQDDPEWFDKWSERLEMQKYLLIYMNAAKSLLAEYCDGFIRQDLAKRLKSGHSELPAQPSADDDGEPSDDDGRGQS